MNDYSLNKSHDAFKSLRIKMGRTPSSQDFMNFVSRINNRSAVQITHNFLNELQRFKKNGLIEDLTNTVKDVKTFLSAFMIIDNKEDIFSVQGDKEEILFNLAKNMIISFEELCSFIHKETNDVLEESVDLHNCLDKFHNNYKLYIAAFNSWKSGDLSRLLVVLRHSYYELQLTKEVILKKADEEKRELREDEILWKEEINKQCQSIKNKIIKLGGEEAFTEMDLHTPSQINLDQIVREVMESDEGKEAMTRDYWKQFSDQLCEKNFSRLYELLEEIVTRFCAIIPNRTDIHNQIRENIDVEFIKQQIDHSVFEPSQFKNLVSYIIDKVKQFGPPVEDDSLDKWKKDYFEGMNEETTYAEVLPKFFNEVLRRLDKIEEAISALKDTMSSS